MRPGDTRRWSRPLRAGGYAQRGERRSLRNVRCHGLVDSPGGIGANGHACWGFEDPAGDFRDAAAAFLAEGVELGQALVFVGGPDAEEVVRTAEPMRSMVADGRLGIAPFDSVYPGGRRLAAPAQWSAYAGALARAQEEGYTGLRVLAEVTSLASPEGAWHEHALWESYADRMMARTSLAALCCFERAALPSEGLAAIASAHPVVDSRLDDLVPFRLFGERDALVIAGEVDAFSSETLRHLLGAGNGVPSAEVLDLEELRFIEHTGLGVLQEYAESVRAHGGRVTVRGGPPNLHRLADLLGVGL